jgi:hypothetical protein
VVKINVNNYIFAQVNSTNRTIFFMEFNLLFKESAFNEWLDFIEDWAKNQHPTR